MLYDLYMYKYILLSLICCSAWANDVYISYGPGLNNSLYQSKFGMVGISGPAYKLLNYKFEVGGLNDVEDKFIGFISPSVGFSTKSYPIYAKVFTGIAFLSGSDSRLTSFWQFNHDFELGIRGTDDVSIGLNYKHMSNAGLVGQNLGRDAVLLKITLPLNK